MKIYKKFNTNPSLALALGFFDGVHKGHLKVISSAVDFAKKNNTKSAIITFKEHPCCFFYNITPSYILTPKERRHQIELLGVDYMYEVDFDLKLAEMSGEDYLKNVLIKYFSPISISTGFNHYFGCNKSGTTELLRKNQTVLGYKYIETEPQYIDNQVVSSTIIRNKLIDGDIESVEKYTGRPFSIFGTVEHGNNIGEKLGYKTANISYPDEVIKIPYGVYKVIVNNKKNAILNFGVHPTFKSANKPILETHIFDYQGELYNKNIKITFVKFIRPERKFNSADELKNQIIKDIKECEK